MRNNLTCRCPGYGIALLPWLFAGCTRAPTFDIIGSFFPSWLVRLGIGILLNVGIVASAAVLGLTALYKTTHHPRTDDATVLANYIGIAPQVEGPLVRLPIEDNQFVRKGELLFEIDDRAYQYALERALSEQAALEGQIADETRKIAALKSAVLVAEANIHSAEADVGTAEQGVSRAQAEWAYASTNLHR